VAGVLAVAAASGAGVARADTRLGVVFVDGRGLEALAVERDGERIALTLPDGGRLVVPASRIVGWKALPPEPVVLPSAPEDPPGESWRTTAGTFADTIARAARAHRVDPVLLTAMAEVESAFDPVAVSPKGASGLLQLMPATAERFGVDDRFDVEQNVGGGARYLSWLLDYYGGNVELALAGYNAGEGAVDRYRGIPPYPETRAYVDKVLRSLARLGGRPAHGPKGAAPP
jgi:hypothetical protein